MMTFHRQVLVLGITKCVADALTQSFLFLAMDIASKYFRDLGALNAVFRKRLNQMLSLHPCVPLADTLQEYISYQTRLEEKYAISLPERLFKTTSIPFEFSAQPPIQPLDPSSLPFASGSEASPFVRPMDPVGFSSNASSSKRKVEEDKGTGKPKKTAAAPLFSFKPGASSSIFASSASDSRNFQTQFDQTGKKNQEFESRLKKPSMNVPISDNPKKPVLEGFSLAKHGEKPFSFQAVFPHLSQNSKEKTVDDSNTDENHAGDTASGLSGEKPVTVRAEATFPLFKSGFGSLPKSPTESREKDNVIQKNENSGSVKKSLFGNVPPGSSVFGGFSFSGEVECSPDCGQWIFTERSCANMSWGINGVNFVAPGGTDRFKNFFTEFTMAFHPKV